MQLNQWLTTSSAGQKLLQAANLRAEESERTIWMFAFYTTTSMGLVWLEACTVALFLQTYGAENGLPWIYLASAGIGSGLGVLYSRLQRFLSLRHVIVLTAFLIAAPLLFFRIGLEFHQPTGLQAATLAGITIFLMRLWLEAIYVLNDLNTSITANQLFNIREIKRTFPLISSGILVADVISGFSLTVLITWVGLKNVIVLAGLMMVIGACILFYLSRTYQQSFPDVRRRQIDETQPDVQRRLQGPLRQYAVRLFVFFILAQVLFLLIDFQFLSQLQQRDTEEQIAIFLGFFNGTLGIFELAMQWLASSRVIERLGVFRSAMVLPVVVCCLGAIATLIATLSLKNPLFISLVLLKFLDELLHYTLFASVGPVLFQPIPDGLRSNIQALVRGIAEPLSTGATGLVLLGLVWISHNNVIGANVLHWLLPAVVFLAAIWLLTIWLLRQQYVNLLVISAERGQLTGDVDVKELKRAVVAALDQPGTDAHKRSCIELLTQLDPDHLIEVLAPRLMKFSPELQLKSLEVMLEHSTSSEMQATRSAYLPQVRLLVDQPLPADVLAMALRYIWLTEHHPDIRQLRPYLHPEVDPIVRGTVAALLLRLGTPKQKAEATNTLRLMLTHKEEKERVMGCRALGDALYMQALRVYVPNLLQDRSLRVRCALLEAIAATHLEEFYPALLRGLQYKSTRDAAMKALVALKDDALPILIRAAEDAHQPELVRLHAWKAIGTIGTTASREILISHLITNWGVNRGNILRILLDLPGEVGIEEVLNRLGRGGIEELIDHEIFFIGQLCAAKIDLRDELVAGQEAEFLRRALQDLQTDAEGRLFQLLKFLYPIERVKAAAFSLQSKSHSHKARGLEILDNTVDLLHKRALLSVLDHPSDWAKLQSLSEILYYEPMAPVRRLQRLMVLRHFLSDWALACCFHLARQQQWALSAEQTLACLQSPRGFVREAVLDYLRVASPRALHRLLPKLQQDTDPIVADQVKRLTHEFTQKAIKAPSSALDQPPSFSGGPDPQPI